MQYLCDLHAKLVSSYQLKTIFSIDNHTVTLLSTIVNNATLWPVIDSTRDSEYYQAAQMHQEYNNMHALQNNIIKKANREYLSAIKVLVRHHLGDFYIIRRPKGFMQNLE